MKVAVALAFAFEVGFGFEFFDFFEVGVEGWGGGGVGVVGGGRGAVGGGVTVGVGRVGAFAVRWDEGGRCVGVGWLWEDWWDGGLGTAALSGGFPAAAEFGLLAGFSLKADFGFLLFAEGFVCGFSGALRAFAVLLFPFLTFGK